MKIQDTFITNALKRMNEANLPDSAVVQGPGSTAGAGGASTRTWTNRLAAPLKCRVSIPGATNQERNLAAQIQARRQVMVTFQAGADVTLTDRFTITMLSGEVITVYAVGGAFPRTNEVMRKVLCEFQT